MATFADFDATAANNTAIAGIDISESCAAANINNAIRELMASCKTFDDNKADGALYVTKVSSVLSTNAIVTGRGGALHHNNAANASGRVFVQASGSSTPSMADGDVLLEY